MIVAFGFCVGDPRIYFYGTGLPSNPFVWIKIVVGVVGSVENAPSINSSPILRKKQAFSKGWGKRVLMDRAFVLSIVKRFPQPGTVHSPRIKPGAGFFPFSALSPVGCIHGPSEQPQKIISPHYILGITTRNSEGSNRDDNAE